VLETIDFDLAGIDANSLVATSPDVLSCGAFPCAFEELFQERRAGSDCLLQRHERVETDFAFFVVLGPSIRAKLLLGFAGLGAMGYGRRGAPARA